MSQEETLHVARELLARLSNAEPVRVAELFSPNADWEIAGDPGALPWIGKKSGRAAVADYVRESRALLERVSLEVQDILADEDRAVILGRLTSRVRATGKLIETGFAIVLNVSHREIVRFQMLEDSFAVSRAARPEAVTSASG